MRKLFSYIALVSLAGCAADIGDPEQEPALEEAQSAMGFNAMGFNAMGFNALTANFDSNAAMSESPLTTESYDPTTGRSELMYALHDSLTREFMKYLVSCALEPGQYVQYKDPFTGANYLWKGEMGYCPKWGDPSGYADHECQEVVSACLLSRVNAFGQHIRLSQRGHDQFITPIPLADVVPAASTYASGASVAALAKKCVSGVVGPTRECSWKPSETGYCTPGAVVTVGLGAPPAASCASPPLGGSNGADTVLRVCNGITGCKQTDSSYLGQADNTCGTLFPSVTFTCPSSGYFTTMFGHHIATSTPSIPSWKPEVSGGGMLGTELDVFGYQEAAFYGNVFDAGALRKDANIVVNANGELSGRDDLMQKRVKGSIYGNMFACWSPIWDDGMAYATYRVCGGPTDENCAAVPVGACGKDSIGGTYPENLCKEEDDPIKLGDNDFQFCNDPAGNYWANAMTVFLNHPCDLIPDANVCKNVFGLTPKNW